MMMVAVLVAVVAMVVMMVMPCCDGGGDCGDCGDDDDGGGSDGTDGDVDDGDGHDDGMVMVLIVAVMVVVWCVEKNGPLRSESEHSVSSSPQHFDKFCTLAPSVTHCKEEASLIKVESNQC